MLPGEDIRRFFKDELKKHGASAKGVGWKDDAAQNIRFEELIRIIKPEKPFTLNDLGCGAGDILQLLELRFKGQYTYHGFDMLQEMVTVATERYAKQLKVHFSLLNDYHAMPIADYTIASGIFNVKNSSEDAQWLDYILDTIGVMSRASAKGFAFNALTSYSDKELMRSDLFYSDPLVLFDYCKKHFSKNVAILHDYGIYDFTILVRKEL